MKKRTLKPLSLVLAIALIFGSCSSSTVINSVPSGARVYIDGVAVGATPYKYSDTKIVGATTSVTLEKEGYEQLNTSFSRSEKADVGAIIGGVFVLVPFLWTMKYNPSRTYELQPIPGNQATGATNVSKNKNEQLRELKQLLDDKIITTEEYEKEKKKILKN